MKKKNILIIAIIVLLVVVLLFPFKINRLKDGGTVEYKALLYKLLNDIAALEAESLCHVPHGIYDCRRSVICTVAAHHGCLVFFRGQCFDNANYPYKVLPIETQCAPLSFK